MFFPNNFFCMQDDAEIRGVDYVVFDEVHGKILYLRILQYSEFLSLERGIDSDFCLALMMEALEKRNSLKLILMVISCINFH